MLLLFPRGDRPDVTTLRATVTGTERIAVTNTLGEEDPALPQGIELLREG